MRILEARRDGYSLRIHQLAGMPNEAAAASQMCVENYR